MPEELGNLLIRVTSQGFDEVLNNVRQLDAALNRIGGGAYFAGLNRQIDEMARRVAALAAAAAGGGGGGGGAPPGGVPPGGAPPGGAPPGGTPPGRGPAEQAERLSRVDRFFMATTKVIAAFWAVMSVPKKFLATMERIDMFNLSLTNMAINANMARSSLVALGTAAEGFGGSRQGVAALGSRFESMTQSLRMGKGGGELLNVANEYGLNIRGTGVGGLATSQEMMRNLAALFERMGDSDLAKDQKLDIKRRLGIDDGLFRQLNQGVKAFDSEIVKATEHQKKMKSAVEASDRIRKRKAELDQAWADAELKMLEAAEPFINALYSISSGFAKIAEECPFVAGGLKAIAEAVGAASSIWVAIKIFRRIFGSGAGAAGGAAGGGAGRAAGRAAGGAAGEVAGRAAGHAVGRAAGGLLSTTAGGAMMIGGVVSDAIYNWGNAKRNTFQFGETIKAIARLEDLVAHWHAEWFVSKFGKQFLKSRDDAEELVGEILNIGLHGGFTDAAVLMSDRMSEMDERAAVLSAKDRSSSPSATGGVTISEIKIEVNSSASDATEVAKAVREELFRQINASIDDAAKRSNLV